MCSLHFLVVHLLWCSGAAEKPYTVEDAVSYNELDYVSVSGIHKTLPRSVICPWLVLLNMGFTVFCSEYGSIINIKSVRSHQKIQTFFSTSANWVVLLLSFRWALTSRQWQWFAPTGEDNSFWTQLMPHWRCECTYTSVSCLLDVGP